MPETLSRVLNDALLFAVSMKRSGARLLMMAVGVFTAVLLLISVGWAVGTAVADAASPQTNLTVTTNADMDDGSCDAHCTLREAMNTANNLPAPDVIVFDLPPLSQTITLNSQLPAITDSLTIDGSTVPSLTISGNNLYRIFDIRPGVSTTLTYMSIISGASDIGGAGIRNDEGSLTIDHVSLRGNRATNSFASGGGISSYRGSLFVHNSTFINNSAGQGGGIGSRFGSLIVSNSYFRGNVVNFLGGGILREGYTVPTIVSNTIFVDNRAENGGGIFSGDLLTLTHSAFSYNSASQHGGGIFNAAEAVISHSTFSHNSANSYGGGMVNDGEAVISYTTFFSNTAGGAGGAVFNIHSLVLYASTFNDNSADVFGGAIVNELGAITVTNSLFQRNVADYGGGIGDLSGHGKTIVNNSAFSSNTATISGGGIHNVSGLQLNNVTLSDNEAAAGGGIASGGTMTMSNSIVANSVGGDCVNSGLFNMNVHNLVEDGSCNPLVSGDPWLGPLADNGGATWTHALLPGSPAIDAGDDATCELIDQRGVVRPIDGDGDDTAVCDIGAVEQELAANSFTVTTNADTNDGSCDAHCTLREAMNTANNLPGSDIILFALLPESHTITLTALLPNIRDDVIIDGSGVLSLTVSGNNLWRVFTIFNISDPNIQAMLANMSIVNGYANNVPGGIWNRSLGTVTLDNVIVKGNVGGFGGGVRNERGTLLVHSSTFINNSAQYGGGGIYNESGTLVISDSYFRVNEVSGSGGLGGGVVSGGFSASIETAVSNTIFVDNMAAYGGGIFNTAVLTLTNSTFSHNLASVYGGGMLNNGEMIISHTTFFSNTAGHSGGAIHNDYSLVLYDSTFNGNSAIQNGGAIVNFGVEIYSATVTATNSLFQGNMAGYGGGIANWKGDKVVINNSTLSGNIAITAGGGISNSMMLELNNVTLSDNEAAVGGGIASGGMMTMSNSLIANSVGGDCVNSGLFNMNVHNLVEDGSCNPLVSGDPWLGPLADNGGATWTHALLPGSPAIDAGDDATCELTDQRGVVRPLDGDGDDTAVCDIGAVEQALTPTPPIFWIYLPTVLTDG